MKRFAFITLVLVLVIAAALPGGTARAQVATAATWTSAIAWSNPSADSGSMEVAYIANGPDATPVFTSATIPVAGFAADELYIGDITGGADFSGSAVVTATVPIVAVYRQYPSALTGLASAYSPVLYSAFTADQAGSTVYLPNFTKTSTTFSQVGIQNLEDFGITATVLIKTTTASYSKDFVIPAKGARILTYEDFAGLTPVLPASFYGALTISGVETGGTARPGRMVVSAQELQSAGRRAYAFEGAASGATAVYMASALCNVNSNLLTSVYYVQNVSSSNAAVFVEYRDTSGVLIGRQGGGIVKPGTRLGVNTCLYSRMAGKSAQAVIYATTNGLSTGTNRVPLVVLARVVSNDGLATAFTGSAQGYTRLALPYVRWGASSSERVSLNIMNVGTAATSVTVKYYDETGLLKGTQTIPSILAKGRRTSNPSVVPGVLTSGVFKGSVVIESTGTTPQPLVVVARSIKATTITGYKMLGEDYTAIPLP